MDVRGGIAGGRGVALSVALLVLGCSAIVQPDRSRFDDDGGARLEASPGLDAGPPEPCDDPGATETVACGSCGTATRFCSGAGVWERGPCRGEGECAPGTVDSVACGQCGQQPARCTATCTWELTGECAGEGECAPGTRTRSGAGCPAGQTREVVCTDECNYEGASACRDDSCSMPGALENVACGMCGTQQRFCSASRVWEYGGCGGEGECAPGTTDDVACGMCGTRRARCNELCEWVSSGSCEGEGECMPGTTRRVSEGCPTGQTKLVRCGAACGFTELVEPCGAAAAVDVILLLDSTGSNDAALSRDLPIIRRRLIAPLLGLGDVQFGVAYAGEFPSSPYGAAGDRPFEGGIEPTASASALDAEVATRPRWNGADAQDATVEALSILAGGSVHPTALGLSCSAGRVAGGCWRPGAQRVIVVHTDSPIHNGPDPAGPGLLAPYVGISPAPATWPDVRSRLLASGTLVIFVDSDSFDPAPAQLDEMLRDLGQPLTDRHVVRGSTESEAACDRVVARVRAAAGL